MSMVRIINCGVVIGNRFFKFRYKIGNVLVKRLRMFEHDLILRHDNITQLLIILDDIHDNFRRNDCAFPFMALEDKFILIFFATQAQKWLRGGCLCSVRDREFWRRRFGIGNGNMMFGNAGIW